MYIVECSDGSFYTGSTINLEKRLWEHNNGLGAKYTKSRIPVARIIPMYFKGFIVACFILIYGICLRK